MHLWTLERESGITAPWISQSPGGLRLSMNLEPPVLRVPSEPHPERLLMALKV